MFVESGLFLSPEDRAEAVLRSRTAPFSPEPGEIELTGALARGFLATGAPADELDGPVFIEFARRLAPWLALAEATGPARALAGRFEGVPRSTVRTRAVFPRPSREHEAMGQVVLFQAGVELTPELLRIAGNRVAVFLALDGLPDETLTESFLIVSSLIDDWSQACGAPGGQLLGALAYNSKIKWRMPVRRHWKLFRRY